MPQKTDRNALLKWVDANNKAVRRGREVQYNEAMSDNNTGETFEEYFEGIHLYLEWSSDENDETSISGLEAAAGRTFPEPLKDFWAALGGLSGDNVHMDLRFLLPNAAALLAGYAPDARPYQKIHSLGLIHMMGWSWSNDKDFMRLEPHQEYIPAIEAMNTNYTCFGWLGDGGCEGHMYLHYDADGDFGATYWHQDYVLSDEPTWNGADNPEALILKCIQGYEAVRGQDPEDPYFSHDDLAVWLRAN